MDFRQRLAMKPLQSHHMQCRYKCFTLLNLCCVYSLNVQYRGVCTGRLSTLISQLDAQGYSRNTGCYRVHAKQNKQYQRCTLRISSAQQHHARWKTQRTNTSCWKLLFVEPFVLKPDECTDGGDNNVIACVSSSWFKAVICKNHLVFFILFSLDLWCQAVTALFSVHLAFHGSLDNQTVPLL